VKETVDGTQIKYEIRARIKHRIAGKIKPEIRVNFKDQIYDDRLFLQDKITGLAWNRNNVLYLMVNAFLEGKCWRFFGLIKFINFHSSRYVGGIPANVFNAPMLSHFRRPFISFDVIRV